MISKATDEETNVEKLGSEGKLNRKTIIFTARIDEVIKMKSIGDVGVDDIKSDVAYVKEKEKQAQIAIVGPLTRSTNDRINLKLLREIDVKVGAPSNVISGCTILNNGKVLFSEYNEIELKDRVTLNDTNGNYILTVFTFSPFEGSLYGMTSIDTNTIAVSTVSLILAHKANCAKLGTTVDVLELLTVMVNFIIVAIPKEFDGLTRRLKSINSWFQQTMKMNTYIFRVTGRNCFTRLTQKL